MGTSADVLRLVVGLQSRRGARRTAEVPEPGCTRSTIEEFQ
jgi:hypothetical protein